ncbi:MAG TPA: SHOCT domain-containing protein [Actinomycetota bacterium]|nr:SHOCT domain-containing protein [Actinomycetota bacterium]
MPGLIRGVARTAVIAGTATAVSNGVSRRQYGRWERKAEEQQAQQQPVEQQPVQQQPAPAPAQESMDDKIAQLKQLAELHQQGILTDDEFAAQKAKLLG